LLRLLILTFNNHSNMKKCVTIVLFISTWSAVNAQELSVKKGRFYKGDSRLSVAEFVDQMKTNDEAYQLALKGKSGYSTSNVLGFIGGFMIGWPLGTAIGGGDPSWALAGIGAGVLAVAIPLQSSASKKLKSATELYNRGNTLPASSLHLKALPNGIGFSYSF